MYIKPKVLWWHGVPDAAAYNVYVLPDGTPFVQDKAAADASKPLTTVQAVEGTERYELPLEDHNITEGKYDIYICAVDAGENESDPLSLADSVVDFTPPAAPSEGGFE